MSWNIVLESHQCVYRQRAHPNSGVFCYNDQNKRRGDCAEDVCPIAQQPDKIKNPDRGQYAF